MRYNIIKEITFKELKAQFDSFSGYILITIFLGLIYFFFLKTFFVNGIATIRPLFQLLPWFLAVFAPAVTMASFASEVEKQTLEYLETKPIKQIELIIGKILGATKIISIAILLTLPLPILVNRIAPLDIGETISGYIGAMILSLALASLGVAISTFYKNQIASFVTASVLTLTLIIINTDITAINLPVAVVNALAQFSIVDNYEPIIRGVISLNNLVYFLIFIVTSVAIAYTNVQKIRISSTTDLYKRTFATILLVAFAGMTLVYLSDYFGQQVGRIDLTSNKRYTLSPVTGEVLREEGKTIIEVYASDNLPPKYKSTLEEIKNILADYRSVASGNLEVRYLDPKTNGERLSTLNVQQVQFNIVGEDQLQIQQGYLALVIMNEDESKKEVIDYISSINELEYQITSYISKIKATSKPLVGFIAGNDEKGIFAEYSYLQQILSSEYDTKTVYLKSAGSEETEDTTESSDLNLSQYNLLVIAGPKGNYAEESLKELNDYISNGGNILYLGDTKDLDPQTLVVSNLNETGQLLSQYGATVNNDMAYDTLGSMQVPLENGLTAKYPYFIIANKTENAEDQIKFLPEIVLTPWASSLEIDDNWTALYTTSSTGGTQAGPINVDPANPIQNPDPKEIPLIAIRKTDQGGTLVISGSSRIFDNEFSRAIQENTVLGLALFENMGKGRELSQIKVKNLLGSQFTSLPTSVKQTINYGAPISSAVLLILIGASRIYRKRKLAKIYA